MIRINILSALLNNHPVKTYSLSLKNKVSGYLGHYLLFYL